MTRLQRPLRTQIVNAVSKTWSQGNWCSCWIERLSKDWKSPIYALYELIPEIIYVDNRRCHEFKCATQGCKYKSRHYLDTKDRSSTGNLIKHAKSCWGHEAWDAANQCKNATEARDEVMNHLVKSHSWAITAMFKWKGKGKVTYSHRMHTKVETKYVCAKWIKDDILNG